MRPGSSFLAFSVGHGSWRFNGPVTEVDVLEVLAALALWDTFILSTNLSTRCFRVSAPGSVHSVVQALRPTCPHQRRGQFRCMARGLFCAPCH